MPSSRHHVREPLPASLPSLKGNSSSVQPDRASEQQSVSQLLVFIASSSSSSGVFMGSSKSSQRARNVGMALLALWSIVSLVVIVVWATSPDLKGLSQCRAALQEETEKREGAKVVWDKNKVALEEKVLQEREENGRLRDQILVLLDRLNATNATLEECLQDKVRMKNWFN